MSFGAKTPSILYRLHKLRYLYIFFLLLLIITIIAIDHQYIFFLLLVILILDIKKIFTIILSNLSISLIEQHLNPYRHINKNVTPWQCNILLLVNIKNLENIILERCNINMIVGYYLEHLHPTIENNRFSNHWMKSACVNDENSGRMKESQNMSTI